MSYGGYRPGAGRKKGSKATHTLEAEEAKKLIIKKVIESLEPILKALIKKAKQGDISASKELFERAFGKVPSAIELPDGNGSILIKWQTK